MTTYMAADDIDGANGEQGWRTVTARMREMGDIHGRRMVDLMGESTSAPWVILVINVNISLVGLTLLSSIFRTSSTLEWHGLKDVGTPSRC